MIELITQTVSDFATNCYLVRDTRSPSCLIIDPGGDADLIIHQLSVAKLKPAAILLTHAHLDHAGAVSLIKEIIINKFSIQLPLYAHSADEDLRSSINKQAALFGLSAEEYQNCPEPDFIVEDRMEILIEGITLKALHTPGHTAGHLCFYIEDNQPKLLSGDTLFKGSVGRTDLPGGNHAQLINSIKKKLLTLPEQTSVYPGHGLETTLLRERVSNPFIVESEVL